MKQRRQALRRVATGAEQVLWNYLRKKQALNIRFRRQFSIGGYIVDFYAPSVKLAIELDGSVHEKQRKCDRFRQSGIENLGIRFLRFTKEDVCRDINRTVERIGQACISLNSPLPHSSPLIKGEEAKQKGVKGEVPKAKWVAS
jgi:very-short-patch-repair endonuclease